MVRDVGNGVREGGTRAEMMEGHCPRAGKTLRHQLSRLYAIRKVNVTALFGRGLSSPSVQTLREAPSGTGSTDSSPAMNLACIMQPSLQTSRGAPRRVIPVIFLICFVRVPMFSSPRSSVFHCDASKLNSSYMSKIQQWIAINRKYKIKCHLSLLLPPSRSSIRFNKVLCTSIAARNSASWAARASCDSASWRCASSRSPVVAAVPFAFV
jgi:hypothetical protein